MNPPPDSHPTPDPAAPPNLQDLGMDLARSFMPSWAKEPAETDRNKILANRFGDFDQEPRSHGDKRHGKKGFPPSKNRDGKSGRGNPPRGGKRGNDDRRRDFHRAQPREMPALLEGWTLHFLPDPLGVEGLARQIKASLKTYPLFDLARLVLDQPVRFCLEFQQDGGKDLLQLLADGSLWQSKEEAIDHALTTHLEKFYRRERIQTDPPKGVFRCIARCGMSGEWIGPPNHHQYQIRLRKIHAERFPRMQFEAYAARVAMVNDEALIQKWMEEQSFQDRFSPLDSPEGTEPQTSLSLPEMQKDFRTRLADSHIVPAKGKVPIPGVAGILNSSEPVKQFARQKLEELRRFPLPMAHILGRELGERGLQIFKAHENITYIGISRPHFLDRKNAPVSESLTEILEYLEANPRASRKEQWSTMVSIRTSAHGGDIEATEKSVGADLSLLLHEGYVIDFAGQGLEVPIPSTKSRKSPPQKTSPGNPIPQVAETHGNPDIPA